MLRFLFAAVGFGLLMFVGGAYAAVRYLTYAPGAPYRGALPELTADERELALSLQRHIAAIAAHEHNLAHRDELERVAAYLEATLAAHGATVGRQEFFVDDTPVRNIDTTIEPAAPEPAAPEPAAPEPAAPQPAGNIADPEVIVVGAHYDSARTSPGANDNATGVAAVLELARRLGDLNGRTRRRIRLVLFVNEEPPYFQTADMGSLHYAEALAERHERVVAMISLETLGFYSDAPGSQTYPAPFGLVLPDRGNFVAFVATLDSRPLLQQVVASFRAHTAFPSIAGVAPSFVPGIDWSDHWAFDIQGFPALMITDTAPYRYPHYHKPTDTPDKVDTEKLARVVSGIERMIRDLAQP